MAGFLLPRGKRIKVDILKDYASLEADGQEEASPRVLDVLREVSQTKNGT
jgi:hypothetical protein